jgi:hypothetical protein
MCTAEEDGDGRVPVGGLDVARGDDAELLVGFVVLAFLDAETCLVCHTVPGEMVARTALFDARWSSQFETLLCWILQLDVLFSSI